jgi:hypothetical protein
MPPGLRTYSHRCVSNVKNYSHLAFNGLQTAAQECRESRDKTVPMPRKNPAAVELGRRGGRATAENRTEKERSEAARKAVEARWAKQKKEKSA